MPTLEKTILIKPDKQKNPDVASGILSQENTRVHIVFDQSHVRELLKAVKPPGPDENVLQVKRDMLAKFVNYKYRIYKGLKNFLKEQDLMDSVDLRFESNKRGSVNFFEIDCKPEVVDLLKKAVIDTKNQQVAKEAKTILPGEIREILVPELRVRQHVSLNTSFRAG